MRGRDLSVCTGIKESEGSKEGTNVGITQEAPFTLLLRAIDFRTQPTKYHWRDVSARNMIEILSTYGPEPGTMPRWKPAKARSFRRQASLVKCFKRTNPNFFSRFHYTTDQGWVPLAGEMQEKRYRGVTNC